MSDKWRCGTKVFRTIYRNDKLVGMMDTPELAAQVVAALIAAQGQETKEISPTQIVDTSEKPFPVIDSWIPSPNPKRISTAFEKGYIINEYPTVCPWNCNNSAFLLIYPGGFFWLYDRYGQPYMQLPAEVNASSRPRWSRSNDHIFTYFYKNQLRQFDIGKSWDSNAISVVHTFSNFDEVDDGGEADLSHDGDHRVIVGDGKSVFVYQLSRDTVFPASVATPYSRTYGAYITPDNNVLISSKTGIEMYDKEMRHLRTVARAGGHMDVMRDINGDEVLIWTNADEPDPITLANFKNGIIKIRLADGQQTGLLALGWSPLGGPFSNAVNISCPDSAGFALVSVYGKDPSTRYYGQIIKVRIDGGAEVVCDHKSNVISDNSQPKASVSRDGKLYLFRSNSGTIAKPDFADTWMGRIT